MASTSSTRISFDNLRKRLGSGSTTNLETKKNKPSKDSVFLDEEVSTAVSNQVLACLQDDRVAFKLANLLAQVVIPQFEEKLGFLKKKITDLKTEMQTKDTEIQELKDKNDELEQYGRREGIRISGITERPDEDTDKIVIEVGKLIGITITLNDINRSHRVGNPQVESTRPRQIICRFRGYYTKRSFIKQAKNLKDIRSKIEILSSVSPEGDQTEVKSNETGSSQPTASTPRTHQKIPDIFQHNIFINEDLTKVRSNLAFQARQLQKEKKIQSTWTSDGIIFIKKRDDRVVLIRTQKQLNQIISETKLKLTIRRTDVDDSSFVNIPMDEGPIQAQ
ncbi:hypothetical protein SNE40_002911 [Patella caerulea]|uniref:Uncharacterized protein n=1 Tax=Patella caerulea TaxID=87958 RepID=A0AAN8K9Q7_PATCE